MGNNLFRDLIYQRIFELLLFFFRSWLPDSVERATPSVIFPASVSRSSKLLTFPSSHSSRARRRGQGLNLINWHGCYKFIRVFQLWNVAEIQIIFSLNRRSLLLLPYLWLFRFRVNPIFEIESKEIGIFKSAKLLLQLLKSIEKKIFSANNDKSSFHNRGTVIETH